MEGHLLAMSTPVPTPFWTPHSKRLMPWDGFMEKKHTTTENPKKRYQQCQTLQLKTSRSVKAWPLASTNNSINFVPATYVGMPRALLAPRESQEPSQAGLEKPPSTSTGASEQRWRLLFPSEEPAATQRRPCCSQETREPSGLPEFGPTPLRARLSTRDLLVLLPKQEARSFKKKQNLCGRSVGRWVAGLFRQCPSFREKGRGAEGGALLILTLQWKE